MLLRKIMKIQIFLSSSLLITNWLIYSAEEKPAHQPLLTEAHIKIRDPHIQPEQNLSILGTLPEPALDTITQELTYEELTRLAQASKTLRERLEPALRKKLIEYWKQPLAFIGMGPENPQSVAFSTDGKLIATGSTGSRFLLWALQSPAPVMADIPNIQVIGKKAKTLKQLEIPQRTYESLMSNESLMSAVAFSPNRPVLAGTYNQIGTVGSEHKILFWEIPIGRFIGPSRDLSTEGVYSVAFSPDGQLLAYEASQGDDYKIRLWNLNTRTLKKELFISTPNSLIVFSPDGTRFAALLNAFTVGLWNLEGHMITWLNHPTYVKSIAFSPDGTILATGSQDNVIRLWRVKSSAEAKIEHSVPTVPIKVWSSEHHGPVDSLAFSPHSAVLASASTGDRWHESDKTVRLWDVTTGQQMKQFDGTGPLAFSPDGQLLATCGKDGYMGLWQASQPVP